MFVNAGLLIRPHTRQYDAVRRNFRGQFLCLHPEFLLSPQIADTLVSADSQIIPRHGNLSRTRREIEQSHRLRTVLQFLDEQKFIAGLAQNLGLLAERVLIHLDDFRVAEHVQCEGIQPGHVAR